MVTGSLWACVFACVSTRVSHCTRLPFSLQRTMRVKRLALCAKKNASGTEFSIGLEPRNPHARRGRKTFHLHYPFESKCSEKMTFRAATNFGSSATSPVKVNKGGRGNVLVLGLPGEGRPWNPTSSSKFLVRVRSNTTAGGKDFMVFRRASENLHSL